jgi:predicted nuclease of predicted toxin-antitoxin system
MIRLYADENVEGQIIKGLRSRGIDILTAEEDAHSQTADALILDRAGELGRVAFSRDQDFLREAKRRQLTGEPFAGVIYAHMGRVSIGDCIRDLELAALACAIEEFENTVWFLPL